MGKSGFENARWWNLMVDAALLSVQFECIGDEHSKNRSQDGIIYFYYHWGDFCAGFVLLVCSGFNMNLHYLST